MRRRRKAARWTGVAPCAFATNGLDNFVKPVKKGFWRRVGRRYAHIAEIHAQNKFNRNNMQECLNGDYKPLLCRSGGFKMKNSPLSDRPCRTATLDHIQSGAAGRWPRLLMHNQR